MSLITYHDNALYADRRLVHMEDILSHHFSVIYHLCELRESLDSPLYTLFFIGENHARQLFR